MKKFIKNNLIGFILGAIIFTGISVYATIKVQANQIEYNTTTVADALDSMYQTMFSNNYSTTEKQVGKWIDRKPLYQATIAVGDLALDSETKVAHNIANIDFIANVFGVAFTTTGQSVPIPFYNQSTQYNMFIVADRTYISVYNYGMHSRKGVVTIQYTKTTDQPITN